MPRFITSKLVCLLLCLSPTLGQAEAIDPAAMNRPAVISERAPHSTLLAVTRAGDKLVAAGERGIILLSQDNGESWRQAKVPTSANLTALRFIDDMRGWAVGHMGIILHTEDGGQTWSKQLDGIEAGKIAVDAVAGSDSRREKKLANYLLSDGPDKPFFDIWMDEQGRGLAIGAFNLIFRTEDGGQRWRYWSPKVDNRFGLHLYSITRLGDDYFIAGEQGLLLHSNDGGEHFKQLETPYEGSWFGILASRSGCLLAYGLRGNVFASCDGGQSWAPSESASQVAFSAATELADGRIVLANQAGQLFASDDQGRSFQPLQGLPGTPFSSLTQSSSGSLVLGSLRGMTRVEPSSLSTKN
jgi:photosystem II stability/assembly factor-like uncharacterized protein